MYNMTKPKVSLLIAAIICNVTFMTAGSSLGQAGKAWQYLKVEEGRYENGIFKLLRILNGDETDWGGPRCGSVPVVLRATLTTR
jgi:hypothetical protein